MFFAFLLVLALACTIAAMRFPEIRISQTLVIAGSAKFASIALVLLVFVLVFTGSALMTVLGLLVVLVTCHAILTTPKTTSTHAETGDLEGGHATKET